MSAYPEITTEQLTRLISNEKVKLVDVRSADAYNGWRLGGEKRGGHIPGARSLPVKWIKYIDWIEVVRSKGFQPGDTIILYGYDHEDATAVARLFGKAGYHDLHVYNGFIGEWSADSTHPLESLQRHSKLVPAEWLWKVLRHEEVEHMPGKHNVVVHAHYRNRDAYLSGHIPGAIDMDTLALEDPVTWNRRTPEELKSAFEEHGITSDTTVIVYGKFMWPDSTDEFPGSAAGHIGAIRCAMIMIYAGVKDVRILNGGFQSWIDAGFEVSTDDVPKQAAPGFGADIPVNPHLVVDILETKEMIAAFDADIVCVRSWPEYIGEVSGYNYIDKKGRIPGTVFGNCGSDAYHMENYRNPDHTMREFHEVVANWLDAGITPNKRLAFYCGTGWRGSEAFMNAWLMGWPRISLFDGGWFEWSSDPGNPYETGSPA